MLRRFAPSAKCRKRRLCGRRGRGCVGVEVLGELERLVLFDPVERYIIRIAMTC